MLYSAHDATTACEVLNEDLQQIYIWAKKWYVKFNPTKSVVLTLDSFMKHQTNTAQKLDNVDVQEVESYKYLCLTFTKNLSWHQHIDSICVKAAALITMLLKLSKATPKNVLVTLYLSFIRSTLEYGSIVYDNCLKQDRDNLEKNPNTCSQSNIRLHTKYLAYQNTISVSFTIIRGSSKNPIINSVLQNSKRSCSPLSLRQLPSTIA